MKLLPIACQFAQAGCPDAAAVYVALEVPGHLPDGMRVYLCPLHLDEFECSCKVLCEV